MIYIYDQDKMHDFQEKLAADIIMLASFYDKKIPSFLIDALFIINH